MARNSLPAIPVRDGDLLREAHGVLVHQANARGVMGSGLAAALRKKWPAVWEDYRKAYEDGGLELGGVVFTPVGDGLWVASVVGQDGYGRDRQHTDYGALAIGLDSVARMARLAGLPVRVPYGLGCGLGGGSWPEVEALLARTLAGLDAEILRKGGD